MRKLKPWAYGPFEILMHAEMHYLSGDDLGRRISMIGFDNAIELAIMTYLNLHPIQRGGQTYKNVDVEKWKNDFHSKVEFFFADCENRNIETTAQKDEVLWFHSVRNDQYHGGGANIPPQMALEGVRAAALEVFSTLFEEQETSLLIKEYIDMKSPTPPPRTDAHNRLIDYVYDMVEVCGQVEYASEVLYALDPNRYRELALELETRIDDPDEEGIGP